MIEDKVDIPAILAAAEAKKEEALPTFKFIIDGEQFAIYFSALEKGNADQMAFFLYKLNTAGFADLLIQALASYGKKYDCEEKTKETIDKFLENWKSDKPCIKPTQVFKDKM